MWSALTVEASGYSICPAYGPEIFDWSEEVADVDFHSGTRHDPSTGGELTHGCPRFMYLCRTSHSSLQWVICPLPFSKSETGIVSTDVSRWGEKGPSSIFAPHQAWTLEAVEFGRAVSPVIWRMVRSEFATEPDRPKVTLIGKSRSR